MLPTDNVYDAPDVGPMPYSPFWLKHSRRLHHSQTSFWRDATGTRSYSKCKLGFKLQANHILRCGFGSFTWGLPGFFSKQLRGTRIFGTCVM